MTTRTQALRLTVCIVLILILLPSTAYLQERKEPAALSQDDEQQGEATAPKGESAASEPAPATDAIDSYTVKPGDTLWDIANTFLKDPFLWPFIWKANPAITNPDLIFTGSKLAIPGLAPIARALKADQKKAAGIEEPVQPRETKPQDGLATQPTPSPAAVAEGSPSEGNRLIVPEEQPLPAIDKYAMLSMGYVNDEEKGGKIVGSPEGSQSIFGYDDVVYVSMPSGEQIAIGDKFLISSPLHIVKHPKTGRRFGRLIKGLGILQIIAKDSPTVLTARITLSFDTIGKNDLVTPYQEPALIFNSSQKKAKDISGYILEVTDRRSINAEMDCVYLDKGSADKVEAGDRFLVYAEPEKRGFPKKILGEVQVIIVKEHTSTAVVRKSNDTMTKGDAVDFKK
jgi:hypothetical protein